MEITKAHFPVSEFISTDQRLHEPAFNRFAIKQFCTRKRHAQTVLKHDNSKDHSEEPMVFYCKECGIISDIVSEDYLFPPKTVCSQCQGLMDNGMMHEARLQFFNEEN